MNKSISAAMIRVARRAKYVQKTGQIRIGQSYTYASLEDFISKIRPIMMEEGVLGPIPVSVDSTVVEHAETRKGTRQFRALVNVTWKFIHESGEELLVASSGCGIDQGDKATAKAMTMAFKYALRQTFCMSTGDDPDQVSSEDLASMAHDPEWKADQRRFCAKLNEMGWKYEVLKANRLGQGLPKPSTIGRSGRAELIRELQSVASNWRPGEKS